MRVSVCMCVAYAPGPCRMESVLRVFVLASASVCAVVGPGGSCCFERALRVVATSALSG